MAALDVAEGEVGDAGKVLAVDFIGTVVNKFLTRFQVAINEARVSAEGAERVQSIIVFRGQLS